jgi:hypothetical protein
MEADPTVCSSEVHRGQHCGLAELWWDSGRFVPVSEAGMTGKQPPGPHNEPTEQGQEMCDREHLELCCHREVSYQHLGPLPGKARQPTGEGSGLQRWGLSGTWCRSRSLFVSLQKCS